jgi:hypothetical protein
MKSLALLFGPEFAKRSRLTTLFGHSLVGLDQVGR